MKPRLFVSTVSQEFKSARTRVEHVLEFLDYEVVQQDLFGTEAGDLRQMLREKIDSCQGLVQIVGEGYGAEPPSIDADHGRVSYTQFEFLYALAQGKKTWVLFAGPGCQRDTPVEKLDLPRDPTHPAPADYQAERRDLQAAYRSRLRSEGHLWHSPGDDTALENAILKLRNDSEELRREFRDWQKNVLSDLQGIKGSLTITTARLRAHLQEASEKARAKDLAEAMAIQGDWQQRETLRQATETAHQQRLAGIEPIIAEFARIEGSAQATDIARELIRIADEQGIPEALSYLQSQRPSILSSVATLQSGIREKLQPLLSGAQLALTAGDHTQAETLFRDLLKADPTWAKARHGFFKFLAYTQGPRAQTHSTLTAVQTIYEEALRHARRLTDDESDNPIWQRDLSVSYNKLGGVAVTKGNLELAARLYGDALKLREKLAQSDPTNKQWQRDLSVSYNNLGDVALAQEDLEQAARLFSDALKLREKLAQSDPDNTRWQRDLSVSYNNLGDVVVEQEDLEQAARLFSDALKLREKLAQSDPDNTRWQRDLSISYNKLGDVVVEQEDLEQAAHFYGDALKLVEILAQSDPDNTQWQRDLSICYDRLGKLAIVQGNFEQATHRYGDALKLAEKLAQSDPGNSQWQRDLSYSLYLLGDLHQRQQQWAQALPYFERSLSLDERLSASDPTNATGKKDVQASRRLVQQVREKLGQ